MSACVVVERVAPFCLLDMRQCVVDVGVLEVEKPLREHADKCALSGLIPKW